MVRPRWHDAVIVSAIVGLLVVGVWALWWDDVRSFLHLGPAKRVETPAAPTTPGAGVAPSANAL